MNKKLNNKGFTLIELLGVLVILIAIMSIAMPTISSSLERSKAKKEDAQNKLYGSAARLYISAHRNGIKNDQCCIDVEILKKEGYIEKSDDIKGCVDYRYASGKNDAEEATESEEESDSTAEETKKGKRIYEFQSGQSGESCIETNE